jgi:hypothetical protein
LLQSVNLEFLDIGIVLEFCSFEMEICQENIVEFLEAIFSIEQIPITVTVRWVWPVD